MVLACAKCLFGIPRLIGTSRMRYEPFYCCRWRWTKYQTRASLHVRKKFHFSYGQRPIGLGPCAFQSIKFITGCDIPSVGIQKPKISILQPLWFAVQILGVELTTGQMFKLSDRDVNNQDVFLFETIHYPGAPSKTLGRFVTEATQFCVTAGSTLI